MTEEIQDDELQAMLNQLDEETVVTTMESETKPKPSEIIKAKPEAAIKPIDDLVASDERKFDSPISTIAESEESPAGIQITKYLEQLDDVTNEVLAACRSDRQEAQDVIGTYKKAIDDAMTANKPPARMWVDGLVKAVEVKAGINGTAVKMMDAVAKVLASTKAGSINQQFNIGGNDNLDEVLSQELSEQDEY